MKDKKILAQAYMDSELTIEETVRFEEGLSDEQKKTLAAEFFLEKAIANKISQPIQCPDILWKKIKGNIQKTKSNRKAKVISYAKWAAVILLTATLTLFISRSLLSDKERTSPLQTHIIHDDPKICEQFAEMRGSVQEVNSELVSKGFPMPKKCLILHKLVGHHKIDFIGASMIEEGKGVKLYFVCCKRPIIVFVTYKSSSLLENLPIKKCDKKYYQITKVTNDYRIMAMGVHNPEEVLKLF